MKKYIQTLSILAIATSFAVAQEAPKGKGGPDPEKVFQKLDTNTDGSLSLEEFKASPRGKKNEAKATEAYGKMDADSKDGVSLDEFKAQMGKGRAGGKGKGEGKGKGKGKGKKQADPAPAPEPAPAAAE